MARKGRRTTAERIDSMVRRAHELDESLRGIQIGELNSLQGDAARPLAQQVYGVIMEGLSVLHALGHDIGVPTKRKEAS